MQKLSRQILIEILWLILSFGVTTLFAIFLFGRHFLHGTLDVHFHDTYFVIAPCYVFTYAFSVDIYRLFHQGVWQLI